VESATALRLIVVRGAQSNHCRAMSHRHTLCLTVLSASLAAVPLKLSGLSHCLELTLLEDMCTHSCSELLTPVMMQCAHNSSM
jgi:hypothetical protein